MATTRKTSTTRSRSTAKSAATPADALMAAAGTAPAEGAAPDGSAALEKKEFLDRVVIASGVRKKDAKAAVEAAFEIVGAALEEGRSVKVQPLGQVRVVKSSDNTGNTTLTLKLRRKKTSAEDASAEVAESGDAE